jgi:hypothetical protein
VQGIIGQNGAFEKKADWNKFFPIRATAIGSCRSLPRFIFEEEANDGTQKSIS